jgi:hypothetical protein
MPTAVDVLQAALEILQNPQQWCQKAWARDVDGYPVDPTDPSAVKFCLLGAVMKAAFDAEPEYQKASHLIDQAHGALKAVHPLYPIVTLNDDEATSHQDIISLLNQAIKEEKRAIRNSVDHRHAE